MIENVGFNNITTNILTEEDLDTIILNKIKESLLIAFPIGTIIEKNDSTNPSSYLGGTWELYGNGRVTVGVDTGDSDFGTVGKTGGSKELQSHNHTTRTSSAGSHNHSASTSSSGDHSHDIQHNLNLHLIAGGTSLKGAVSGGTDKNIMTNSAGSHTHSVTVNSNGSHTHTVTVNSTGSGDSGNLQPYITVYRFIRTA